MRASALLLLPLLTLGCGDDGTNCCKDGGSQAAIEATVLDQDWNPVVSAGVKGIGRLPPCDPPLFEPSVGGQATTDQAGLARFDLFAVLGPPGTHCVSLVVTRSGEAPDTVGNFDVEFYMGTTPPDTVRLVVTIGGD